MAKKRIRATHRLRRPHSVIFDPTKHFVKGFKVGERCTLEAGCHVIPTELQLSNMPDRFQSLSTPEPPAEAVIDDTGDAGKKAGASKKAKVDAKAEVEGAGNGATTPEEGASASTNNVDAAKAVETALGAVGGDWDALTGTVLRDLALGYGLDDIPGTGSGGRMKNADYRSAVQEAFGAAG